MSRCRTCGKTIYSLSATNIFRDPENALLHRIEAISGLLLLDQPDFPAHICGPCEVALREAISFREKVLKVQMLLLNSVCVVDAFHKIDLEGIQKTCKENIRENEPTYENLSEHSYENDEEKYRPFEDLNNVTEDSPLKDHNVTKTESKKNKEKIRTTKAKVETTERPSKAIDPLSNLQRSLRKPKTSKTVGKGTKKRIDWKSLTEEQIVELARERRKRNCVCDVCGKHFNCPSNFKLHMLRHTGVKNYQCQECPSSFITPNLLRRHQFKHMTVKPYTCQYCDKTFATRSGAIHHERNIHTNYKPYKCNQCHWAFSHKPKLAQHMNVHSDVRSFHCKICMFSFKSLRDLNVHNNCKSHKKKEKESLTAVDSVESNTEIIIS